MKELWFEHFKKLYQNNISSDEFKTFEYHVNKVVNSYVENVQYDNDEITLDSVTTEEVRTVCSSLKCKKAGDINGVQYEHF